MGENISEYEVIRRRNIAEKEAFLAKINRHMQGKLPTKEDILEIKKLQQPQRNLQKRKSYVKQPSKDVERRRSVRIEHNLKKVKRVRGFKGFRKVERTITKVDETGAPINEVKVEYVCDDKDDSDDDDWDEYERVEFYVSSSEDESSSENEDYDRDTSPKERKRKPSHRQSACKPLMPEQVTDEMIHKIMRHSVGKVYDSVNGTCCHQCRQKTLDTKSICRSGFCVGVRGQFCGFCLQNRYGEDVEKALKDPNWACPPCRNLCNCSICRTRQGKAPTGILAPYVKERGYDSVKGYLLENENDHGNFKKGRKIKVAGFQAFRKHNNHNPNSGAGPSNDPV